MADEFDPFASIASRNTTATTNTTTPGAGAAVPGLNLAAMPQAKPKGGLLFNPFMQSGPIDSPSLTRRVARQAGMALPHEEDSDEEDSDEEWSAEGKPKKKAPGEKKKKKKSKAADASAAAADPDKPAGDAAAAAPAPRTLLPSAEILKIWRKHQVEFIQAVSVHPDITSLDFQKKLLKATVFETCCAIVEDPQDDRTALLFALGLLKRMTSQDGAISGVKFPAPVVQRLCDESKPSINDPRVRAFAITLLAAMSDKEQLEKNGFYEDCLRYTNAKETLSTPIVESAVAIAITNFSLDLTRQRRILDAITLERLTAWAKSVDPDLKTCAAAFIGNLVANEECKYQIIHSGGLTILLKLTSAPGNPPYKPHAARGLANLALHDEAHVPMLERGVLHILANIVLEKPVRDETTLRSAVRCLGYLATSQLAGQAVSEFIAKNTELHSRLESLQDGRNEQIQKHAERALTSPRNEEKGVAAKFKHAMNKKPTFDMPIEELLQRRPSVEDLPSWNLQAGGDVSRRNTAPSGSTVTISPSAAAAVVASTHPKPSGKSSRHSKDLEDDEDVPGIFEKDKEASGMMGKIAKATRRNTYDKS